jgi:glutathione S-transferase
MRLGGDQFHAAFMRLNSNAVMATLTHDGQPVIESSLILYHLDDGFPVPASRLGGSASAGDGQWRRQYSSA